MNSTGDPEALRRVIAGSGVGRTVTAMYIHLDGDTLAGIDAATTELASALLNQLTGLEHRDDGIEGPLDGTPGEIAAARAVVDLLELIYDTRDLNQEPARLLAAYLRQVASALDDTVAATR